MRNFDISEALGDVNTHLIGEAIPGSARMKDWRRTKFTTIAACACLALVMVAMTVFWSVGVGSKDSGTVPAGPAATGIGYGDMTDTQTDNLIGNTDNNDYVPILSKFVIHEIRFDNLEVLATEKSGMESCTVEFTPALNTFTSAFSNKSGSSHMLVTALVTDTSTGEHINMLFSYSGIGTFELLETFTDDEYASVAEQYGIKENSDTTHPLTINYDGKELCTISFDRSVPTFRYTDKSGITKEHWNLDYFKFPEFLADGIADGEMSYLLYVRKPETGELFICSATFGAAVLLPADGNGNDIDNENRFDSSLYLPLSFLDDESILEFAKNDTVAHDSVSPDGSSMYGSYKNGYEFLSSRLTPDSAAVDAFDKLFCEAVREAARPAEMTAFGVDGPFLNDQSGVETITSLLRQSFSDYDLPLWSIAHVLDDIVLDYYITYGNILFSEKYDDIQFSDIIGYDKDDLVDAHTQIMRLVQESRSTETHSVTVSCGKWLSATIAYTVKDGAVTSAVAIDEGDMSVRVATTGDMLVDLMSHPDDPYMIYLHYTDRTRPGMFAVKLDTGEVTDLYAPLRDIHLGDNVHTWEFPDGIYIIGSYYSGLYISDMLNSCYVSISELPDAVALRDALTQYDSLSYGIIRNGNIIKVGIHDGITNNYVGSFECSLDDLDWITVDIDQ